MVSFLPRKNPKGLVANDVGIERIFGEVTWYSSKKRFGFISGDDHNSYFVHQDGINCERLYEHQAVSFLLKKTRKGLAAYDVVQASSCYQLNTEILKGWIEMAQAQTKTLNSRTCVYIFNGYEKRKHYSNLESDQRYSYKIGYSSNLENRLKNLKKGHSGFVLHTIITNTGLWLEQILHITFSGKEDGTSMSWEWFQLNQDDLKWLKSLRCIDGMVLLEIASKEIGRTEALRLLRGRGQ